MQYCPMMPCLVVLASCFTAQAAAWQVPESWVRETARLESSHRDGAVGDNGRSRGRYQIQAATWRAYSTVPWRTGSHDPVESRRVCRLILADCARACRRDGKVVAFKAARWYYRHGGF